jgi:hypothetical protein
LKKFLAFAVLNFALFLGAAILPSSTQAQSAFVTIQCNDTNNPQINSQNTNSLSLQSGNATCTAIAYSGIASGYWQYTYNSSPIQYLAGAQVSVSGSGIPFGTYQVRAVGTDANGNPIAPSNVVTINYSAPGTGIIPANRMTAWQPGVTYNGGIPNRTTVCASLTPSGGDDTSAIQAALNNCPANQVVQLAAGVFKITRPINITSGNITLRGAGPGQGLATGKQGTFVADSTATILYYQPTVSWGPILSIGNDPSQVTSYNLASDAVQGNYSLTLTSNPGLSVGQLVKVDQNTDNDPDVYWGPNHDGPGGTSRQWFMRQDRSLAQIMEITAVNGNTVTFDTPFHHNYTTAGSAQLSTFQQPILYRVGIEELQLFNGTAGGNGNFIMGGCAYCWVKHIESRWADGAGVWLTNCFRCELRDSYIHESANPNPGGGGYLIALSWGTSDSLVENNISWAGNKVIVGQATGGGNVIAYNYMDDAYGANYPNLPEAGVNMAHQTTSHMELIEGNYSHRYSGDSYWGNVIDMTVFRNHLSGIRAAHPPLNTYVAGGVYPYIDDGVRTAVDNQAYNYRGNFVGNVLGKSGEVLLSYNGAGWQFAQTSWVYEDNTTLADGSEVYMWYVGAVQGAAGAWSWQPNSYQTQLRQGNWDWYTQSQTWYNNPIGGTGHPGDGTPQTIPNSLYLTSKPAFFGSNPWPWVDPSTGTTYVLPAKARFDAGTPNTLQ